MQRYRTNLREFLFLLCDFIWRQIHSALCSSFIVEFQMGTVAQSPATNKSDLTACKPQYLLIGCKATFSLVTSFSRSHTLFQLFPAKRRPHSRIPFAKYDFFRRPGPHSVVTIVCSVHVMHSRSGIDRLTPSRG